MNDLDGDGYALADIVLTDAQCDHLAASLPAPGGSKGGVRNLLDHPSVRRLLTHARLGNYLWSVIGRDLVAVNGTLLDKTAETNWRVQWHQDRIITVRERLEVNGYGRWTSRAGLIHVDAPAAVLEQMIAVRVHLDDCQDDDGLLRVIPGSHKRGKLTDDEILQTVADDALVALKVPKGALLLMRPLLVHASSVAPVSRHRRVLHLEFAPPEAISPLQWHSAIPLRRAA